MNAVNRTSTAPVTLVTGAAGGIGAAVVDTLGGQGHAVVAADRDADRLAALAERAKCPPRRTECVDITDPDAVEALVARVEGTVGPIEHLVNGAGVLEPSDVADLDDDGWRRTYAVNTDGVMHVSRAVTGRMTGRGSGAVVTIASNASRVPRAGMAAYASSKAAAAMFTRCLGLELAADGVRCNVVSPGSTDTDMLRLLWTDESGPETTLRGDPARFRLGIPTGRIAAADDVAGVVAFLCSDAARQITLENVCVDGGAALGA